MKLMQEKILSEGVVLPGGVLNAGGFLNQMIDTVFMEEAGASLIGCCVAIEKGFQHGGDILREKGYRIESLAIIDEMDENKILFR